MGDLGTNISEKDYSQIKLLPRVMPPTWTDDVAANHKQLTGLSRQESEQRFLWRVRKLARYGEQRFRLQAPTQGTKDGEAVLSARGLEIHQNGESQVKKFSLKIFEILKFVFRTSGGATSLNWTSGTKLSRFEPNLE